jgi:hypothetical protein
MQISKLKEKLPVLIIIAGTLLIVVFGARYTALNGFSYSDAIYLVVFFLALAVAFSGIKGFRVGMVGAIFAMGIGYRTLQVHQYIQLHPAEVAIWGLAVLLIVQKITNNSFEITWWLPKWVVLMAPFWGWAWAMAMVNGNFLGDVIREFRNFIVLVPLYIILSTILHDRTYWRTILTSYFAMASLTAFLGVFEFFFPGVTGSIPGFTSMPPSFLTPEGFERASFGFWGSPAAVFILILSLPLMFVLLKWWRKPFHRVLIFVGAGLHLLGVYIGGYRSVWLFMGLQIVVWLIVRKGLLVGLYLLLPLLLLFRLIPETAQERMATLYAVFEGEVVDSSAQVRLARASLALDAVTKQPLGGGWAYAGWVHNDLLQVAANQGVPALLVMLYGFLLSFVKVIKGYFDSIGDMEQNSLYFSFFLSMCAALLLFASQGVLVLPQFSLPVWYIWALVDIFLKQANISMSAPT